MCYKAEVQKRNAEKLERKFREDNTPSFIQDFFLRIASRAGRINYYCTIKNLLEWLIEKRFIDAHNIADIKPEDLSNVRSAKITLYFTYLKDEKGIKLTTLQTKKNQLMSFWGYLVEENYVEKNIVHGIKSEEFKPAKTNRQKMIKMPLHDDIIEMIEKINKKKDEFIRTRNLIILRVLRGTGLREAELAGLDMDDVFIDDIYIDKIHPRPYILVISKGTYDYTDDGKDIVFLTKDAIAAFEEWFEYRATLTNIIDDKAVFINKDGKRLTEWNIQDIFKNYSNGKLTPHMMRHEYTTTLHRESKDSTFVQEQGRWKSPKIMTSTYDSGVSRSLDALDNM